MNLLHQVLVAYRLARRKLHVHLVRGFTAKRLADRKSRRAFLSMRVDVPPRFDERSTIDRFRRESGNR